VRFKLNPAPGVPDPSTGGVSANEIETAAKDKL
jgi:hypothetical protein